MGRRLTERDISAARHETEVFNSMLKRGEIKNPQEIKATYHIVCGCGAEGCIFLSHRREVQDEGKTPQAKTIPS